MKSLPQAWSAVSQRLSTLNSVCLPLQDALNHVVVSSVLADRDIPAINRSAMDGYAFSRTKSVSAPLRLAIRGEIRAGDCPSFKLRTGECARIFTGAVIPKGADTVVMQENTKASGTTVVHVLEIPERGANILKQGENARAGTELIPAGTLLSPVHIAMCAAVGKAHLDVVRKPGIAVLTTGEELLDATDKAAPHQIRDSNGPMVLSQLRIAGFPVKAHRRVRDNERMIASAARNLLKAADVLVVTGGVSVGKYDFVPAAIQGLGATLHVHGIAMKPGKPQLFATISSGKYIFGLPGNPLSVVVGLHEFVLPALRILSGFPEDRIRPSLQVSVPEQIRGRKDQHHFMPARLTWTCYGPQAKVLPSRGSADLAGACKANGFLVVPPSTNFKAGSTLEFRPWGELP